MRAQGIGGANVLSMAVHGPTENGKLAGSEQMSQRELERACLPTYVLAINVRGTSSVVAPWIAFATFRQHRIVSHRDPVTK